MRFILAAIAALGLLAAPAGASPRHRTVITVRTVVTVVERLEPLPARPYVEVYRDMTAARALEIAAIYGADQADVVVRLGRDGKNTVTATYPPGGRPRY